MRKERFYPPEYSKGKFHCPHCGVFAKQYWAHIEAKEIWSSGFINVSVSSFSESLGREWTISKCEYCGKKIIWLDSEIIYPKKIVTDLPNDDLSEDIKKDYFEAAKIFTDSPRASAALLRLALQKLCKQLGEKGDNINEDIKNLVKNKGLNPQIQKLLDILRITGNNAVHPGKINIEEKPELVLRLFQLINFIVEKMVTELKEIEGFYEELPEDAKEQIKKRDSQE